MGRGKGTYDMIRRRKENRQDMDAAVSRQAETQTVRHRKERKEGATAVRLTQPQPPLQQQQQQVARRETL